MCRTFARIYAYECVCVYAYVYVYVYLRAQCRNCKLFELCPMFTLMYTCVYTDVICVCVEQDSKRAREQERTFELERDTERECVCEGVCV